MENTSGDKIVLMGLPGSGKSTLGKHLSLNLEYPFYDLDELIVEDIGCSIAQFFKETGEEQFRLLESRILQNTLLQEGSLVLSTGGGAPCFYNNINVINEYSTSIYIDVPTHVLVKRLMNNGGGQRPMFYKLPEEKVINKILSLKDARENFYNQAKIKLSGVDITTELILSELRRFKN
ncbi:MAG TPA: shikimate kinase [Anditalea sp.]|nr:shikimate kinase [Anditalea sp.]